MAKSYYETCATPKSEPRKRAKGRKDRAEAAVKKIVRDAVTERDGYCRLAGPTCEGPSEWAHLADHRRSKTRGLPPEIRHTTAGTVKLCRKHHQQLDAHAFTFLAFTAQGADGTMTVIQALHDKFGKVIRPLGGQ